MPVIQDTAYPRINSNPSLKDLNEIYTPTPEEQFLAQQNSRTPETQLGFLVLLKTFQRLGYAIPTATAPPIIILHISESCQLSGTSLDLRHYDRSKSRNRHLAIIRDHLNIESYGRQAQKVIMQTMKQAVTTLQDLGDIINLSLEELVRQRYELPGFSTLERLAQNIRKDYTQQLYQQIAQPLSKRHRKQLDGLFTVPSEGSSSDWNKLKDEPGRPTLGGLKALIERLRWLSSLDVDTDLLKSIPVSKLKDFADEAQALDAQLMKRLPTEKRYTLALTFLALGMTR